MKFMDRTLVVTSPYGPRTHPVTGEQESFHPGIDLQAHYEKLYSPCDGLVIKVWNNEICGNAIRIDHTDYQNAYKHLSEMYVKEGDWITKGTCIGKTGNTGRVTGPHLHFEQRIINANNNWEVHDPYEYCQKLWQKSDILLTAGLIVSGVIIVGVVL